MQVSEPLHNKMTLSSSQNQHPVCILGGSSDIGLALGLALHAQNWPCVLTARNEQAQERIFSCIPTAHTVLLDADSPNIPGAEPESLPERCTQSIGSAPGYLVDCLHSRYEKLFVAASPQELDAWALADIAVRARVLRAFSQAMLTMRFGRCLFISSSAAHAAAIGQSFYAAAKLAGEALYRSIALEMGKRGVTTVSLRLGWIEAGRGAHWLAHNECHKRIPLGRYVRMNEVTETILWLLSSPAQAINGTTVTLDGGFSICKP